MAGNAVLSWAGVAVGLINGLGVAWVLGAIALRRFDSHQPETFARIKYAGIKTSSRPEAGIAGWFDERNRKADKRREETAA